MAVMSLLSRVCGITNIFKASNIYRNQLLKEKNAFKQAVRNMSGGDDRTMHITPSRFQYTKFKDDLHFFVALGVIPLGLLILYVNIFIGPATLTEIPEGYEPKYWEYYKHPIQRFISKHFQQDPQIIYEKTMHGLNDEKDKLDWGLTVGKVKKLMSERDDYKGWYYLPSDQGRHYRYARKEHDELEEYRGYR